MEVNNLQVLDQRVPLVSEPTPLRTLSNISQELNKEILIKEDDTTGICLGGNKVRKLEYLIHDALEYRADCVITTGGLQSNHARLTTAAARKYGLKPELILKKQGKTSNGNVMLNQLMGAEIHTVEEEYQVADKISSVQAQLERSGKRAYAIPLGGSDEVGVLGYVKAAKELRKQLDEQGIGSANIVMATGSGGTLAGVIIANSLWEMNLNIVGISVSRSTGEMNDMVLDLITRAKQKYQLNLPDKPDFQILDDYIGPGYGIPANKTIDTIKYVAKEEGVILDPVYTGKAMTGLLDSLDWIDTLGKQPGKAPFIFWHTGGAPAVFAYPELLDS